MDVLWCEEIAVTREVNQRVVGGVNIFLEKFFFRAQAGPREGDSGVEVLADGWQQSPRGKRLFRDVSSAGQITPRFRRLGIFPLTEIARPVFLRGMSAEPSPKLTDEELLRLATFAPHVGTGFSVQRGDEWVTLRLAEAVAGHTYRPEEGESFSLVFTAGPEKPMRQGIHAFQHPAVGPFDLFITPIAPDRPDPAQRDLRFYEAVVNRASKR